MQLETTPENYPPCKIWFRSYDVGGLGEYPVCHCSVSFFVFFGSFITHTGRAGGPILTICMSYDVFSHKDIPFGGSVDMPPHSGVWPRKLKRGVNRHFKAKLAKYKNLDNIETTASIPTKIWTTIKTTKYSSWVVQRLHDKSKIADGRHFGNRKIVISLQTFDYDRHGGWILTFWAWLFLNLRQNRDKIKIRVTIFHVFERLVSSTVQIKSDLNRVMTRLLRPSKTRKRHHYSIIKVGAENRQKLNSKIIRFLAIYTCMLCDSSIASL